MGRLRDASAAQLNPAPIKKTASQPNEAMNGDARRINTPWVSGIAFQEYDDYDGNLFPGKK
jgi:hypothetical protein